MNVRPDSVEHQAEPVAEEAAVAGRPGPDQAAAVPSAEMVGPPRNEAVAVEPEPIRPPTREDAPPHIDEAPEIVVPVDPSRAGGAAGPDRIEPAFAVEPEPAAAVAAPAPEAAQPEAPATTRPEPRRGNQESRAAALAASAAALTPPRRRRWATVRRVIGYGAAVLCIGWLAGLASAASVLGWGGDGAAAPTATAAAPGATTPALGQEASRQFAALHDEIRGLRQQVTGLRGELDRTRHDVTARLAALSPAAPDGAAATPTHRAAAAPAPTAPREAANPDSAPSAAVDVAAPDTPAPAATADNASPPPAATAPSQPLITASIPAPAAPPALPQPAPANLQRSAALPPSHAALLAPSHTAAPAPLAARPLLQGLRGADDARTRGRVIGRYAVRDVIGGHALLEGRDGFQEVRVGDFLPGAGRVDAITRRNGGWVVVTERGLITSAGRY